MRLPLETLSERLQLSQQTIVHWVDRHLVDAELRWDIGADNREVRMIELTQDGVDRLAGVAAEYREGHVTTTEARRILKIIDRKKVKKMLRAKDILPISINGETHIQVGSLEDYLMRQETVVA